MAALRSLAFNLLFMPWTAVVVLFGMPLLLLGRTGVYLAARTWARGTFWLLAHLIGLRHRVLGRERTVSRLRYLERFLRSGENR